MSDLIDRQAAIDYFVTNVGFHDEDGYPIEDEEELREIWTGYFDGIPSAEHEKRTEERTETHACDYISRQQAIDEIDEWIKAFRENGHKESAADACLIQDGIIQLPPAHPEQNLDEWCTDCKEYDKEKHSCPRWNRVIRQALADAKPEQRTGKCMWCERLKERNLRIEYYWIDEEGYTASFSEPHIVATGIAKFCPNCGAKMEGDAE